MGGGAMQIAATAALTLSCSMLLGAMTLSLAVPSISREEASAGRHIRLHLDRTIFLCALSCAAAGLLSLWLRAAEAGETGLLEAGPALYAMITDTAYGRMAACGIAVMLMLPAIQKMPAHALRTCGMLLAALSFCFTRAAIGHAAETGTVSFPAGIEWLHLVSTAVWSGVVVVAAWQVVPAITPETDARWRAIRRFLASLSLTATLALAFVVATGLFNTARVLDTLAGLVTTVYGRVLTLKLILVLLAVTLGGYNRFVGFPALSRARDHLQVSPHAMPRLLLVLRIESLLLATTLALAAWLINQAPPAMPG